MASKKEGMKTAHCKWSKFDSGKGNQPNELREHQEVQEISYVLEIFNLISLLSLQKLDHVSPQHTKAKHLKCLPKNTTQLLTPQNHDFGGRELAATNRLQPLFHLSKYLIDLFSTSGIFQFWLKNKIQFNIA